MILMAIAVLTAGCAGESGTSSSGPASTAGDAGTSATSDTTASARLELGDPLTLEAVKQNESGREPAFTILVSKPVLKGSDDPRVDDFNRQVSALIDTQVADFKRSVSDAGPPPVPTTGNSLKITYSLKSPPGALISLLITSDVYYDGAAHPGQSFQALTYDLTSGNAVPLAQLFQPGAPYLQLLADFCQKQLSARDALQFPEGAAPTAENFQIWVVTKNGIEITFGDYQVAPYAMGPQTVLVPYSQLRGKLDLNGPLGQRLQ